MKLQAFACTSHRLVLAAIVVALIFTVGGTPVTHAQTFTVFHAFSGNDGSIPNGDLIRDEAGNFYGTTQSGEGSTLFGVVFKLDSSGNETVLHKFTGGADGANPYGRLRRANDGTLYGMTLAGGDPHCLCGTVFKLTTDGSLRVLHSFLGGMDGMQNIGQPGGGLIRIGNELYGATYFGGTLTCDPGLGCGVIFKVNQSGEETVLYRFSGGVDGAFPRELIADAAGNIYGVTESGYSGVSGNGGVFKLDKTGQLTVLYNFQGGNDGSLPYWRLTAGENGILYGTTVSGGGSGCSSGNCGVIFSLDTTNGVETVLHRFGMHPGDGQEPSGALLDASGNFFGTTWYGGTVNGACSLGCGVVYVRKSNGGYTVLYGFMGGIDGSAPNGALIQDSAGDLYGAAAVGGASNNGLIFQITR
jgi:uncharacterized repeat protein (TIGR03803 family)